MDFWPKKKLQAQVQESVAGGIAATDASDQASGRSGERVLRPIPEDALVLVPMRNAVLFPGVISPITIGRAPSVAAVQEAARHRRKVGFLLQRDPQTNQVGPKDLYRVGTAGQVVRLAGDLWGAAAGGANHLVVQGERRFSVLEYLEGWPFLVASVVWIPEPTAMSPEIEARFVQLKSQAAEAIHLMSNAPDELAEVVQVIEAPGQLADMVANLLDIKNEEKQDLLETFDLGQRMDKVLAFLAKRVEVMRLSKEIGDKTRKEFGERQREQVLREQMHQIQKELRVLLRRLPKVCAVCDNSRRDPPAVRV